MTIADDIKKIEATLTKLVQLCRDKQKRTGVLPLEELFAHGIVARPDDFKEFHKSCTEAASTVNNKTISHQTAAFRVVFDIGRCSRTSVFRFYRCGDVAA